MITLPSPPPLDTDTYIFLQSCLHMHPHLNLHVVVLPLHVLPQTRSKANRRKHLRLSSGGLRLGGEASGSGVGFNRNQGDLHRRGAASLYTTTGERQGANAAGNHGGASRFSSRFTALSRKIQRGSKGIQVLLVLN